MTETRRITRFLKQIGARRFSEKTVPREELRAMRQHALEIFKEGIAAVAPQKAIQQHVSFRDNTLRIFDSSFDLSRFSRVLIVGAGKSSAFMALALEELLGERIETGYVNVKYGHGCKARKVIVNEAGHPLPDENGIQGTRRIMELLTSLKEDSLVICVLSGGGSALLVAPSHPLSLSAKQKTTRLLLHCGASIKEINCVRKHLSSVKGGLLAKLAYPATVISLIISDVVGDDPCAIASGPTAPDPTTFSDALRILEKYDITHDIPVEVTEHIMRGIEGRIPETPKPDDPIFQRVHNFIIANNYLAIKAAKEKALQFGYNTFILSSYIEGDTREAASFHTAIVKEILASGHPITPPACVLSGGETTVKVRGMGKGGRNQEFVLASALEIASLSHNTVIFSAGTDGTDGPTDAAGAIADSRTLSRARELSIDPWRSLEDNNSYYFFQMLDDLIITGPTQTNVMDIRIILIGCPP